MIHQFILSNWIDIFIVAILFFLALLPVIPPTFAGLNDTYFDTFQHKWVKQKKFNFFELIVHLPSHILISGPALSMGFRGTVTLLLFIVLGADLYFNRKITDNAVILSIVGIVALYLEKIVDSADEISLWKSFTWKARKFNK